jgi:flagellar assembly protein FliH
MRGTAVVDRFDWQEAPAPGAGAVPLFGPRDRTRASGIREFALPGLSAERTAALEQEAFARGYADGVRAAEAAAAARIDELLGRLSAAIHEIAALRPEVLRQTERDVVRLAIAMAERMVQRHIDANPAALAAMARAAVAKLGSRVVATVHLHPADHARVGAGDPHGSIELKADPQIPPGGVMVRSAFGAIDASLEAQVRELTRALLGEPPRGREDGEAGGDGHAPGI